MLNQTSLALTLIHPHIGHAGQECLQNLFGLEALIGRSIEGVMAAHPEVDAVIDGLLGVQVPHLRRPIGRRRRPPDVVLSARIENGRHN